MKDDSREPFWDESARAMVRGILLHVLTARHFPNEERNLITVRNLIVRGEWQIAEAIREQGHKEETIDPPHLLLWRAMERNPAFDGLVAGIGSRFHAMMKASDKTFEGVLQSVALHTEFLDSPGMRRVLAKSDFKLRELKTRPEGMTLYLSLPQRFMDTHYRWLRMMVALTTTEMEITRGQPATGHRVLMVLDEFAGLKRMTSIENAVAQIAGFGVKLFFVLQSLEQLKQTYKDGWETFLANAGLKIFFSNEDGFTREYVSKLAGETEIIRELQSTNESRSENESVAQGTSESQTQSKSVTKGTSQSFTKGKSASQTKGASRSGSQSQTDGTSKSHSVTESDGTNESTGSSGGSSSTMSFGPGMSSSSNFSRSGSRSRGSSHSTSSGVTDGTSKSFTSGLTTGSSLSDTQGASESLTAGISSSDTVGTSTTTGTSQTRTEGMSRSAGTGRSESVHRRPLIQPDEVSRHFGRIEDKENRLYPGLALVMVAGGNPLIVRRTNYFDDPQFIDCFSEHPDHAFKSALPYKVEGIGPLIQTLEKAMAGKRLAISKWFIKTGKLTEPGNAAAKIECVPPDNRTVHIKIPYFGKVSRTAEAGNELSTGGYAIPNGLLFSVKNYPDIEQPGGLDPFQELREACHALERQQPQQQQKPVGVQPAATNSRFLFLPFAAVLILAVVLGGVAFFSGRSSEHAPRPQNTVAPGPGPITLNANPDVDAILAQGDAAYKKEDYKKALELYLSAANAGNPEAIYDVGRLYERKKQIAEAKKWYLKAAQLDDPPAMVAIGRLSKNGSEWFKKAAEKGDEVAISWIGGGYMYGERGFPLDPA